MEVTHNAKQQAQLSQSDRATLSITWKICSRPS